MRSFFTFTLAVFILTAYSQTPVSVTSTPPPSMTPTHISTVTPTFLPTITSTPLAPDLTPEIMTAAQEFFGSRFEVRPDGRVMVKETQLEIPGLNVIISADGTSWEMGRTHEYDGDPNFYQPITKESVKLLTDGTLDFECWRYTPEGEWIRESYSTADGVNIEGRGEHLYTVAEMQKFLTNPANVDMSVTEFDFNKFIRPSLREGGGGYPKFEHDSINEFLGKYYWGDNIVPIPDGMEGYIVKKTAAFAVSELRDHLITIYYVVRADGTVDEMFGEGGGLSARQHAGYTSQGVESLLC